MSQGASRAGRNLTRVQRDKLVAELDSLTKEQRLQFLRDNFDTLQLEQDKNTSYKPITRVLLMLGLVSLTPIIGPDNTYNINWRMINL